MNPASRAALPSLGRGVPHACVAALFFIVLLVCSGAFAQTSGQSGSIERQVKAAYLYKFASYVEWPDGTFAQPDSPLVIGVIGADALADELEHIVAGQTVGGRAISTRKLAHGESLAGLHILFIGRLDPKHVHDIFTETKGQPLLTVTESDEAHAMGGMIHFVMTGDRLRFEVALAPVGLGRLKISARMLTAAYKVKSGSLLDLDATRLSLEDMPVNMQGISHIECRSGKEVSV